MSPPPRIFGLEPPLVGVLGKWHLIPSSGFSRVHECDRWIDRGTVKSVAVDDIAFSGAT